MKSLSIKNPWITLIAHGYKTIETRKWKTSYRGELLLVGSKRPKGPFAGMAACLVELVDCRPMRPSDEEQAYCHIYPGDYSWILQNIRRVQPVSITGRLGIYEVPDDLVKLL